MDCDCSCDIGDYEEMKPCKVVVRKARKQYKCIECGCNIEKGDKYEYVRGLCCGSWDTFRTCKTCVTIRDEYTPSCWIYGCLADALWDCLSVEL